MPLKNRLKEYRARDGVNQSDMGRLVGVSRQTISMIERGDYSPSVTLAIKIARYFQVRVEDIFIYEEDSMKTKSENRKALPKFIVIMVLCLLLGAAIGVGIGRINRTNWTANLGQLVLNGLIVAAPWLLLATVVVNIGGVSFLFHKAKGIYTGMNSQEDDEALERIDRCLNPAMVINSVCTIVSYFLFAIPVGYFMEMGVWPFLLSLALFIVNLVAIILGQQKIVDFIKVLNPEKHGSVYDTKFSKTWYASCDERERSIVCQAAFAAYKATNTTCLFLWLALVLGNTFLHFGLMPIAAVSLIWLVSTLTYSFKSMELERKQ